jgi:hypothetical protein
VSTRGLPNEDASGAGGAEQTDSGFQVTPIPCTPGLSCQIEACVGKPKTTISGVVYDPAGRVPLYNVVVYVPGDALSPIPDGAQCHTCNEFFSGTPIAPTLSGADGSFVLKDVPAGRDIPLVIQVGKWRREIVVPEVAPCTDTLLTDREMTRLPRDQSEGHIPKIAIATGGSDALECLVRKIGISDSEFTNEHGSGRVNLFYGWQWIDKTSTVIAQPSTMADGTPLTPADTLWSNASLLDSYDVMLLSCEGTNDNHIQRTAIEFENVRRFADVGGRIYGSHFQNTWIKPDVVSKDDPTKPDPYPEVVNFPSSFHGFKMPITALIDTSFPKGNAFSQWLDKVGASPPGMPGTIEIKGAEHSVDSIVQNDGGPQISYRWIYGTDTTNISKPTPTLQYFSFNTPVGQTECGRMVFSDVHVSAGAGTASGKLPFPDGCNVAGDAGSQELSPQEKALEFMIFDLSSCVQPDSEMPQIHLH